MLPMFRAHVHFSPFKSNSSQRYVVWKNIIQKLDTLKMLFYLDLVSFRGAVSLFLNFEQS